MNPVVCRKNVKPSALWSEAWSNLESNQWNQNGGVVIDLQFEFVVHKKHVLTGNMPRKKAISEDLRSRIFA